MAIYHGDLQELRKNLLEANKSVVSGVWEIIFYDSYVGATELVDGLYNDAVDFAIGLPRVAWMATDGYASISIIARWVTKVPVLPPPAPQTPIGILDLPNRIAIRLSRNGISTVEQLLALSRDEFLAFRLLGKTSIYQIQYVLLEGGYIISSEEWPRKNMRL